MRSFARLKPINRVPARPGTRFPDAFDVSCVIAVTAMAQTLRPVLFNAPKPPLYRRPGFD
jgi:hypothetical protein